MKAVAIFIITCALQLSYAEYYRVCFYASWSSEKGEGAVVKPKDLDASLCTHIVYAFASIDSNTHLLVNRKDKSDHETLYKELVGLKKNGWPKLILSVGGAGHEKYESPFSKLVETGQRIEDFVQNATMFLRSKGFDGLDIDWEYPTLRPKNCCTKAEDKKRYTTLIKELRKGFESEERVDGVDKLLLTVSVPNNPNKVDTGYEIEQVSRYVDFMTVMAYGMTSSKRLKTGHHSPMARYFYNVPKAVNAYLDRGVPSDKLVLGIPTYGRSYRLKDPEKNGFEKLTVPENMYKGPVRGGEGYLTHYEICEEKWDKTVTDNVANAPYSYKKQNRVWVGYDDEESIERKIKQLVFAKNLKGVAVWTIDMDDFANRCKKGKFPLLTKIKEVLEAGDTDRRSQDDDEEEQDTKAVM